MTLALLCLLVVPAIASESTSEVKLHQSPATAQALVVEALKRTQSEFVDDACLVSVRVHSGSAYMDNKSHGSKENLEFFYDHFEFTFRSPKRKGYFRQSWCEPAGDVGVLGGPCFGGMSKWWSEDLARHDFHACLDEMSFDSDKAAHRAFQKGVTNPRGGSSGILAVRGGGMLKGRRKALKGKAAWVLRDEASEGRCLALAAKDGRELFDGPCEGLR